MIHESADVDTDVVIGLNSQIWNLAQVRAGAQLGNNVIIGRGVYIGSGVSCGDDCKIQNYALIYEPAKVGQGVFIGPAVVLTNDLRPRAVNTDGSRKSVADWESVGVTVGDGASIGARSVCVAPITIGRWAMVGAGSVVTRDVPDHALVVGNPARQIGWVCRCGRRLIEQDVAFICMDCDDKFTPTPSGLELRTSL